MEVTWPHAHPGGPPSGDTPACCEEEGADQQLQGPTGVLAQQVVPAKAANQGPSKAWPHPVHLIQAGPPCGHAHLIAKV